MAKRVRINAPTKSLADADYAAECRFAIEPSFTKMIELAAAAGWDRQQVAFATMYLAAEMAKAGEASQPVE